MNHSSQSAFEQILLTAPYADDPLRFYRAAGGRHSILFESAEIDSKENLKSLILCHSALKIICRGRRVRLTALNPNGWAVIRPLSSRFPAQNIPQHPAAELQIHFPSPAAGLDEDSRLEADSPIEVLRAILRLCSVFGFRNRNRSGRVSRPGQPASFRSRLSAESLSSTWSNADST